MNIVYLIQVKTYLKFWECLLVCRKYDFHQMLHLLIFDESIKISKGLRALFNF